LTNQNNIGLEDSKHDEKTYHILNEESILKAKEVL